MAVTIGNYDRAIRQRIASAAGRNAAPIARDIGREMAGSAVQPGVGQQVRPSSGQGFDAELDAFMAAIREQESGGRYGILGPQTKYGRPRGAYQILDGNWDAWAAEAGIPGADWRDPAAQDRVARFKMMQYYRQFGSWDAVAVAWFAGPGRAATYVKNPAAVANLSDVLGTSVARYVQKASDGMNSRLGQQAVNPPTGVTYGPSTAWDAQSVGEVAQMLADHFGVKVGSHVRDPQHNAAVGGADNSDHLWGGGIDFKGSTEQMMALAGYLDQFTGPNGPLRLVLDPVNETHGTGPHVHVSFKRNNNQPLTLPGGQEFGPSVQVGVPDMTYAGPQQTAKRGATALVAAMRGSLGDLMGTDYAPKPTEQGTVAAENTVQRARRVKGVLR